MPVVAIDPAFDRNALPIVGSSGLRLIDDTLEAHASLARIIHTEMKKGMDHRGHGAPIQRKQEATRCWEGCTQIDDNGDEHFGLIEVFLSVNSVSELCVLCG